VVERLKQEGNYTTLKSTVARTEYPYPVLAWHMNTRSRTFLTCCQPAAWLVLPVSVADRTNRRERERRQKRRPLRDRPAPPFRASRPQAFKISNTDTAAAYGVANVIATGRPVPSGRHGVNPPAAGPGWQRLAEIGWPTPGPACHWLRRVGGGVPVRAQWAL
jgi:hypothetical protein